MGKKGNVEIEEIENGYELKFNGKKRYYVDLDDLVLDLTKKLNVHFKKMNSKLKVEKLEKEKK